jgi:hypothetical protein
MDCVKLKGRQVVGARAGVSGARSYKKKEEKKTLLVIERPKASLFNRAEHKNFNILPSRYLSDHAADGRVSFVLTNDKGVLSQIRYLHLHSS